MEAAAAPRVTLLPDAKERISIPLTPPKALSAIAPPCESCRVSEAEPPRMTSAVSCAVVLMLKRLFPLPPWR